MILISPYLLQRHRNLDSVDKITMAMLYVASFASSLGMLSTGLFYGWSSPALPLYYEKNSPVTINQDEGAWIASIFTLGAAIGPILSATVANKIGRKILMISTAVPSIFSWIIIIFARKPWELYVSRFLSGIATGVIYTITPLYIGEISPAKIRGVLLTTLTIASRIGQLMEYSVCPFVSLTISSIISMTMPIVFALCMFLAPESPYYLVRLERVDEARKALSSMRKGTNVDDELRVIELSVKAESERSGGFHELFMTLGNRKALSVAVILVILQQFSGSQALTAYSQIILDEANFVLEGKYLTIILGSIGLIFIGICTIIVDRQGRRPLLILSSLGSGLSTCLIAVYFNLQYMNVDTSSFEWLPAIGCILFFSFYPMGLAGLPFTIVGELFPMNIKSLASTIAICACNIASFIVTKSYQLIDEASGIHTAFWLYTCGSLIGVLYIYLFVPETRKRTLQEIQISLNITKNKTSKMIKVNI